MRRILLALLLLLAAMAPASGLHGQEASPPSKKTEKAVLISIHGQLSQTMTMTLQRAIDTAKETGAENLVIEINTPGGEMMLMEQLRDMIFDASKNDSLKTIAYVNNSADSAGALIAMACQGLYMAPLAHMGSATPVTILPIPLPTSFTPPGQDDMTRKIKSRARAVFRATAIETGRNSDLAEAMVDPDIELVLARVENEERVMTRQKLDEARSRLGEGKVEEYSIVSGKGELLNMTAREAMEWGFINGIAETREELLQDFLGVEAANVTVVESSWSESLVNFLESIHWLLLIAGLILLFVEFQIPGFGIFGILGLSCLAILFFDKWLTGLAEITEILLVVGGLGLLAVEVFLIPGTFATGILGALMIGAGLILSFQPFVVPKEPWQTELLKDNVLHLSGSIFVVLLGAFLLTKFLPRTPVLRRFILDTRKKPGELHGSAGSIDDVTPGISLSPGDRGVAKSYLRPVGKVLIKGAVLDVQSEGGFIEEGEDVQIVRIVGNFIFVRKCEDQQP